MVEEQSESALFHERIHWAIANLEGGKLVVLYGARQNFWDFMFSEITREIIFRGEKIEMNFLSTELFAVGRIYTGVARTLCLYGTI